MADKKIHMPASTAGLTRYFEDYKSKIEFKPGHIVVIAIVIMLITIVLHVYGNALLGLS
ncbi:MAG: preprotein translocase subunit Sec61beta [Candidatus Woesearchaeota archaeon]